MMHLSLLVATLSQFLSAAPQPFEKGLYFYRTPQSLFPSGQLPKADLVRTKIKGNAQSEFLVQRGNKNFWLSADKILRDVDLAKKINPDGSLDNHDIGYAINIIPCAIRKGPSWNHESIIQIPEKTKLNILGFESSWVKVSFNSVGLELIGYVDLNNVILKADFASFILNSKNQWRPVKYREHSNLVTDQNEVIPILQVQAMVTRPQLGIVAKKDDKLGLSLKNHVFIKKMDLGKWQMSQLKGHGIVYWQENKSLVNRVNGGSSQENTLTTEDLLQREISAISFHPSNPHWGLASSNGIYLTTDGDIWKKIPQFGDENHPVAMNTDGIMIVGPQISQDFGKTFRHFLRWEKIAKVIEINEAKAPQVMHLHNSYFENSGRLALIIDTGAKKVKVSGYPLLQNSWQFVQ